MDARKVLIFSGGWEGHRPHEAAAYMKRLLGTHGLSATCEESMDCLDDAELLSRYDLVIPNWSDGVISAIQLAHLTGAVESGIGLAGIHGGMGAAFRDSAAYHRLVGGHFLKHPEIGEYIVDIRLSDHPVTRELPREFAYASEKYFMEMDDAVTVLADTDYSSEQPGLRMPVVWVKQHGRGRIFYSALGHDVPAEYKEFPEAERIFLNGCLWACR